MSHNPLAPGKPFRTLLLTLCYLTFTFAWMGLGVATAISSSSMPEVTAGLIGSLAWVLGTFYIADRAINSTRQSANTTKEHLMLILTRKPGETIRINDDISVTVLSVSGQQVRLGIAAPESVEVQREEIYQRIQAAALQEKGEAHV